MMTNIPRDYSHIRNAEVNGFDCDHCANHIVNRTPVRSNDLGPFFCSFYCAFRYRGDRGDANAAANADRIAAIFNRNREG